MRSDMFLILLIALVSIGKSNEVTVKDISSLSKGRIILDKGLKLAIGDTLEISGVHKFYKGGSKSKMYVSLKDKPKRNQKRRVFAEFLWMRAKKNAAIKYTDKAGEKVVYNPFFSGFQEDLKFKLTMVFLDAGFAILVNGDPVGAILPYALQNLPLSEVSYIYLPKKSDIAFNELRISSNTELYQKYNDFKEMVNKKTEELSKGLAGKSVSDIREYANSGTGSMALLQWKVYTKLLDRCGLLDLEDETIKWVLSNQKVLEMLLTSGDNDNMKRSIEILANLVRKDPALKTDSGWKIKWAVGLSIAASKGIWSYAAYRKKLIDPYQRYDDYLAWAAAGVLYEPFFKGTAWHLSIVAGSLAEDSEMEWVRGQVPDRKLGAANVAGYGCGLVKYTSGFSYHGEPRSLQNMHKYGGVCGAISNTASYIGRAFGVPTLTIGQPGHCAYLVRVNEKWQTGFSVNSWSNSTMKTKDSLWHNRKAAFMHVMEACQMKLPKYVLSEKLRVAAGALDKAQKFAILSDAIDLCPENFGLWEDLKTATVPGNEVGILRKKADAMIAILAKVADSRKRSGLENLTKFTEKIDNVLANSGPVTDDDEGEVEEDDGDDDNDRDTSG